MKTWKKVTASAFAAAVLAGYMPHGESASAKPLYTFELPPSGFYKEGDRGKNVEFIQHSLNRVIGANLTADGIYGPATKKSVMTYQKSKGLTADGIYGPVTHKTLTYDINIVLPDKVLKLGNKGNDVKTVQVALNELGASLSADGVYGPKTKAAVLAFQKRFPELADDGIYGPKTRDLMEKVLHD
ncbi:peptidoglycan-binding protein [Bacillus mangrovi]|uniref:Peptidoglycan-binding protein n=1 Tax=Metabacillus mangrovi TaxID=1491830 RepID=A0A7X2V3D3_9BACI|nr:peptidoglycan-binding protein [Metabacillus mangrovi]MTH52275.1 peptidoglycan-binding protein [Metabacillus mangrovi]